MRRRLPMVAMAAIMLATSGCSLMFVKPPHQADPGSPPQKCTTSKWLPAADSLLTTLEFVRIGLDLGMSDAAFQSAPLNRSADLAVGGALGALFLTSAIYGFTQTGRCAAGRTPALAPAPAETEDANEHADPRTPTPPAASAAPEDGAPSSTHRAFDRAAARAALMAGLSSAAAQCGATGARVVNLTFEREGSVGAVTFDPPFESDAVAACVARLLRQATIPPFDGDEVPVRKQFDFGARPPSRP